MRRGLFLLVVAVCLGWPASTRMGGSAAAVWAQTITPVRPRVLRPRPIRIRPTRPPRPARPSRFRASPTTTRVPEVAPPTPTPTATPQAAPVTDCEHACVYTISQMRMLWYGSLSFTAVIKQGGCAALTPNPGDTGTVRFDKFLAGQRRDTGHEHSASFVLGENGAGTTSLNGRIQFSRVTDSYTFSYSAPVPSIATIRDGQNFPVEATMCLIVGNQPVKIHMVCQGKNQGMLCHEG